MSANELEDLRIDASVPQNWLMLLGSLGFCVLAFLTMQDRPAWMWLTIVFFGICGIVAIHGILLSFGGENYLHLREEGFEIVRGNRKDCYRWAECSAFAVRAIRSRYFWPIQLPAVVFLHKSSIADGAGALDALEDRWWLAPNVVCLPNDWEMEREVLCALLNDYRERALSDDSR